jgi:hypothetical protein
MTRTKGAPVEYEDRTPLMRLAGISNEWAAKRDLRRRFRQRPLEEPMLRAGARFYVTARVGRRAAYLAGPYATHMAALSVVPCARELLRDWSERAFVSIGTASSPGTVATAFGRLSAFNARS